MRSFAAALALIMVGVEAASHRGSCADNPVSGKSNFNEDSYAGRWFEVAKDKDFYDDSKSCPAEDFVKKFNGDMIVARNYYDLDNGWTQKTLDSVLSRSGRGEYVVFTEGNGADFRDANTSFYVLNTDYSSYSIEYVCVDVVPGLFYVDSVSVKSRTPQLPSSEQDYINVLLTTILPNYD